MVTLLRAQSFWMAGIAIAVLLNASPLWAGMKSIAKDNTNIRSGPGFKYKVLYQASRGYPLEVLARQGEWVRVRDWEGAVGWVHTRLLSSVRTAVVLAERANVRSGPGMKNSVRRKVTRGEIYLVMAQQSSWTQIGYYFEKEHIGWIREDLVFGN